jgi:hypothetical protein
VLFVLLVADYLPSGLHFAPTPDVGANFWPLWGEITFVTGLVSVSRSAVFFRATWVFVSQERSGPSNVAQNRSLGSGDVLPSPES